MARWVPLITLLCTPLVWATEPPPPNPDQPVNYVAWLNEKYGQGIEQNAADVYEKAVAAFVEDEDLLDLAVKPDPQRWTESEREKLQDYIDRNAEALRHYAQAARLPKCYFTLSGGSGAILEVMLPHLRPLRGLAKLTAGRARLRLLDGDLDRALQDVATLMRAGRHLQEQPILIHMLVGVATSALAYEKVLFEVPRLTPGSVDYIDVVKKLRGADKPPRRPTRQLEIEMLMLWDAAQRFLKDTDGDGRFDRMDMDGWRVPVDPPLTLDEIVRESREYFARCRDAFVPGYEASRQRFEGIDEMLRAQKGKTLLGILAPSFAKVAEIQRGLIATRNAYRVTFMLHAYHAKHDKWPDDLEAALPGKNIKAALDPFANKLFRYALRDGEPFLYSVGVNGVDDGGEIVRKDGKPTWGKTGDYVFWPRSGR